MKRPPKGEAPITPLPGQTAIPGSGVEEVPRRGLDPSDRQFAPRGAAGVPSRSAARRAARGVSPTGKGGSNRQRALSRRRSDDPKSPPVEKPPSPSSAGRRRPSPFAGVDPGTFSEWISAFLSMLDSRHYRPGTLRTYGKALERLTPILLAGKNASEIIEHIGKLKAATQSTYLAAARRFDRWCESTGRTEREALRDEVRIKHDQPNPRPLSPADVEKLNAAAHDAKDVREKMLWLLLGTGIRIGEALALHGRDVVLDKGREGLNLRNTKGRADHFKPLLSGELLALLQRRRVTRDPDRPLLPNLRTGRALSYDGGLDLWHSLRERAGVNGAVAHQTRHTHATNLHRSGASATEIQHAMGWAKPDQAAVYVKVTQDEVREMYERQASEAAKPRRRRPEGPKKK